MKRSILLIFLMAISLAAFSQKRLNVGAAVIGDNFRFPGVAVNIEYEKLLTKDFSLPLKMEIDYVHRQDFNSFSIELHKGFKKYFPSGLFVEQYIGIGAVANFYKTDDIWYFDERAWGYRYAPGANWGIMPSVGLVVGYDLTKNSEKQNLIFIKPDVYWNLGFRPLHLPYSSIQIGYMFNLKTF